MIFHQVGKNIPGLATAKTLEMPPSRIDEKRRGFLPVKRTEPDIADPALFQIDSLPDDLYNVSTVFDPLLYVVPRFLHAVTSGIIPGYSIKQ